MKLTPELLEKAKEIVAKHHAAFAAGMFGTDVIPAPLLEDLKAAGLIEADENSIEAAYIYGQLMAKLQDPKLVDWTLDKVLQELGKNPIPLSAAEKQAVQTSKLQAGIYITGLSSNVQKDVSGMLVQADHEYRAKVREGVSENIASRQTHKQLKSKLGYATGDWTRNLDRVAITEKHNAMQAGVGDGFAKRYGADARVSVRPLPGACKHCKRLHLGPDGAPRIFKLSQLAPPGANVGQKAINWVPTIGSVHPHCQCQLIRVPTGWGYDEAGTLVPGGEFGVEYSGEDVDKSFAREDEHLDELVKAYRLEGEVKFQGLDIAIETGAGNLRFWKDHKSGDTGATVMQWPYGYIRGTLGTDGDHVDCYVGPNPECENAFIVHQRKKNPDGSFGGYDEDKIMLGFSSAAEAKASYHAHYDDKGFFGSMTTMPMEELKAKLKTTRGKPRKLNKADLFVVPNSDYVEPEPQPAKPDFQFFVRPDTLEKAGGHKYTSKKKVGDHWVYTYAEEHGGKVRPHESDPTKVALKVPKDKLGPLKALAKKHGLTEPTVGGKYAMLFVQMKPAGTAKPKPAAKKEKPVQKKKPTAPAGPFNAAETAEKLSKATGLSPDVIKTALMPGPAKPGSLEAKNRTKLERAMYEGNLGMPGAINAVLAHGSHNTEAMKATLKGIVKGPSGSVERCAKEYSEVPAYDIEALTKVELIPKQIQGRALCQMQTRALKMGHGEKGDYVTGDFRHELGHAIHGTFLGDKTLNGVVEDHYAAALKAKKANPPTGSGKMDSNWYEETWGVMGKRGIDNAKEDFAEHYRCYHRALHQEHYGSGSKGSSSLATYTERHPEMARIFDARYTLALMGLEAKKGGW